jgi:hypothetical protein
MTTAHHTAELELWIVYDHFRQTKPFFLEHRIGFGLCINPLCGNMICHFYENKEARLFVSLSPVSFFIHYSFFVFLNVECLFLLFFLAPSSHSSFQISGGLIFVIVLITLTIIGISTFFFIRFYHRSKQRAETEQSIEMQITEEEAKNLTSSDQPS